MSATFSKFRSTVASNLAKIGRANGQQPPKSNNNVDALMYEMIVAMDGYSYFERRKEQAKQAVLDAIDTTELDARTAEVVEQHIGQEVHVYDGEQLSLTCGIKRPAEKVNTTRLRTALIKSGMPVKDVDKLYAACTEYNRPARTFKVVVRGDALIDNG